MITIDEWWERRQEMLMAMMDDRDELSSAGIIGILAHDARSVRIPNVRPRLKGLLGATRSDLSSVRTPHARREMR